MHKNLPFVTLILVLVAFPTARAQNANAAAVPSPQIGSDRRAEGGRNEIGQPFIRNYSPKEYSGAHPQNWAIVQDQRGVMYFGNGLGVLEYDAVSWRLIALPNASVVRSLDLDVHGRIYAGAQGEFGYLAADALGQMHYVSLLAQVPPEDREFTDVWRTFVTEEGTYFQTATRLFRFTSAASSISPQDGTEGGVISQVGIKNAVMKIWKPTTRFNRASLVRGRLYIPQVETGIMAMVGDSLQLLPGTERFAEEIYAVLLPFDEAAGSSAREKILIATASNGLFLYDGATARPFVTAADDFLRASEIYRGALLRNGTFALATRQGGVAIVDRNGQARIINKETGLRVNKVYFVYPDRHGALWLGLENGISRVETPSPFSLYGESFGLKSTVYGMIKHQGKLYVSTNAGVFYLRLPASSAPGKIPKFLPVQGIAEQSWTLLALDGDLLVATGDGVFRINGDRAVPVKASVSASFVSLVLQRSRLNRNRIYVGLSDGLASLRYDASVAQWIDEGRAPGIYEQIWSIVENEEGALWLGTDAQGVIHLEFPAAEGSSSAARLPRSGTEKPEARWRNLKLARYGVAHGLAEGGVQVFAIGGSPIRAGKEYFVTSTGIFGFDRERQVFVPDSTFAVVGFGNTQEEYNLREDRQGDVWVNFGKESAVARRQNHGAYVIEKTPFLRFAEAPTSAIYPDEEEGVVWFGGADGLVRYDGAVAKDYAQDYAALIRRVIVNEDSVIFAGTITPPFSSEERAISILPHSNNALRFEFSASFYEAETENRFQSFLEGFDDHWSAWSKEAKKDYTNLPKGDYRFRVRARNIYHYPSSEAVFAFAILPPWYRAWWAYLAYVLAFSGGIAGLVGLRTRQLHARSRELEKTVQERTQEIRQQAVAIQSQADELEEKNREIIKTQEQLIVQEKLASLGQLTAGIAHEIKNPLNFVNNFAKLSVDLIVELREGFEKQKEKLDPAAKEDLQEVMGLLSQNIAKIDEHGRRADSIVKGMLLHSRGESGERRPVDLNAVLDEYVMLAYHGMRGTDATFNVKIEKDYDPAVGRVEVFPQDISRVFLNLVNNACYATHQKARMGDEQTGREGDQAKGKDGIAPRPPLSPSPTLPVRPYAPTLSVSTKNLGDRVEIRIRDNGTGIPASVLNKVFHPFFTTKPAGQGTGLGLSLSYDIVVHEHSGEIKVETKEGEFTEFVVRLPRSA